MVSVPSRLKLSSFVVEKLRLYTPEQELEPSTHLTLWGVTSVKHVVLLELHNSLSNPS